MNLISIILSPFFLKAFIGLILTALVAASIGPIIISRGMSFLTAEVAHATLGGAALGVFIIDLLNTGLDPLYMATIFGVLSGLFAAYGGRTGVPEKLETAIGVSMAISMSIAVFFLGVIPSQDIPKVWGYLLGDILLLSWSDILVLSSVVIFTIVIYLIFYREFLYIALDMEGAKAMGFNVSFYHYLSVFIASLAIVVSTKAIGSIMVYAIIIVPSAIAVSYSKNFIAIGIFSFFIVFLAGILGLLLSFIVTIAPSGIIGLIISSIYLITLMHKK